MSKVKGDTGRDGRPGTRRGTGLPDITVTLSGVLAWVRRGLIPLAYVGGVSFIGYAHRYLEGRIKCPGCGGFIAMDAERCPVCGRTIASDSDLWEDPKRAMSPLNEVRSDLRFSLLGILIIISLVATALDIRSWPAITISIALSMLYSLMRARKLAKGE